MVLHENLGESTDQNEQDEIDAWVQTLRSESKMSSFSVESLRAISRNDTEIPAKRTAAEFLLNELGEA